MKNSEDLQAPRDSLGVSAGSRQAQAANARNIGNAAQRSFADIIPNLTNKRQVTAEGAPAPSKELRDYGSQFQNRIGTSPKIKPTTSIHADEGDQQDKRGGMGVWVTSDV